MSLGPKVKCFTQVESRGNSRSTTSTHKLPSSCHTQRIVTTWVCVIGSSVPSKVKSLAKESENDILSEFRHRIDSVPP